MTTTHPPTVVRVLDHSRFALRPQGRFDLRRSVTFGFGQRDAAGYTGVMRLAFCVDGYRQQVGVVLRQERADAELVGEIAPERPGDVGAIARQVARMLSVDLDARPYDVLSAGDPLLGPLSVAAPGLRPPLFHSAYEAAAWAVLSARRPQAEMAGVRRRLAEAHGAVFRLADEELAAFPTPEQLLAVSAFPGIPQAKLDRLHAVAGAALDGRLDTARLRAMDPVQAGAQLRELPGIGPFYADLVIVRALGHTDVIPSDEPRVRRATADLLGRTGLTQPELETIADTWRPWRTWALVLVRSGATRITPSRPRPGTPAP